MMGKIKQIDMHISIDLFMIVSFCGKVTHNYDQEHCTAEVEDDMEQCQSELMER